MYPTDFIPPLQVYLCRIVSDIYRPCLGILGRTHMSLPSKMHTPRSSLSQGIKAYHNRKVVFVKVYCRACKGPFKCRESLSRRQGRRRRRKNDLYPGTRRWVIECYRTLKKVNTQPNIKAVSLHYSLYRENFKSC